MSLINDALKRAKEAQQHKSPPESSGGPPLRPVEPRPQGGGNVWLMLAFAAVVAAAAILLWQWFQQRRHPQIVASNPPPAAQTAPTPGPAPQPPAPAVPPPTDSTAKPVAISTRADVPVPATPTTPTTPSPALAPALLDSAKVVPTTEANAASTNSQALPSVTTSEPAADAVPKPAPLKLQGIIFHPTRPSVVINGKLLFVGDRFGEWRVIAIDAQTVTLAGGGKTNVLTLD